MSDYQRQVLRQRRMVVGLPGNRCPGRTRIPTVRQKGAAELVIRSHVKSFFPERWECPHRRRAGPETSSAAVTGCEQDRSVACGPGRKELCRAPEPAPRHVPGSMFSSPWWLSQAYGRRCIRDRNCMANPLTSGRRRIRTIRFWGWMDEMSRHWPEVLWKDVSGSSSGPYEPGLLKLNCDKALHILKWARR